MDIPDALPEHLLRLGAAFSASRVFHSAIELDLFTKLERPMTASEIREILSLHQRSMPDFVDCLVALKLLERSGNGVDALYSNTPETAKFLSRHSKAYGGGMLYSLATRSYKYWTHLTERLQTGKPQNEAHPRYSGGDGDVWERTFETPESVRKFMSAMVAHNTPAHQVFARKFDFTTVDVLLDIGGGSGQLCCEVARENKEVRCICLEVAKACIVGRENVHSQGLGRRVEIMEGSCWTTTLPKCDVVVYSMILHSYDDKKKKVLLQKGYDSLCEGGRLVVIDIFIDEARDEGALEALLFSLHMIIVSETGRNCSISEVLSWTQEVGFKGTEAMPLHGTTSAVIAYK